MTVLDELHEARCAEGVTIDPKKAEVTFWWTQVLDPYGDIQADEFPEDCDCVGRSYFARSLPDGKWIYFNSDRTGKMHIWRMKPDGTEQEQVTKDDYNNWFPHPSPDGKWLVFLSYQPDVQGHPENKDVMLRLLSLADGKIDELAKLFGGQGTINVPSWSPDSKKLAFVSYQLVP